MFWASYANSNPTEGKVFFCAFMENLRLGVNGVPAFRFQIISKTNTTGTVSVPGQNISIPFSVNAGEIREVDINNEILYTFGSGESAEKGVIIEAKDNVEVIAIHGRIFFNESTKLLPVEKLGFNYKVICREDYQGVGNSEFCIVATEDNTIIEITPSARTKDNKERNVKFTISLNRGEIYQLQSVNDLSGSTVNSNKKIGVFAGATTAFINGRRNCFPRPQADSHLWEQLPPINFFDKQYLFVNNVYDTVTPITIVTVIPRARVVVNGTEKITDAAGVLKLELNGNALIESDTPMAIAQFNRSYECTPSKKGDPGMSLLSGFGGRITKAQVKNIRLTILPQPLDRTRLAFCNISDTFKANITVVTKTTAVNSFKRNGKSLPASMFKTFRDIPQFSFAYIPISQIKEVFGPNDTFSYLCEDFTGFNDTVLIGYTNDYLEIDTSSYSITSDSGFLAYYTAVGTYDDLFMNLSGYGSSSITKPIDPVDSNADPVNKPFIQVFPVPAYKSNIFVKFNIPKQVDKNPVYNVKLQLYDEVSKLIYESKNEVNTTKNKIEIPAENLAPAIYYLRITVNDSSKYVFKVIKM